MDGKMKACVLHGIRDLRCEMRDIPQLKKGQVLLKVCAAGICGSDMERVYTKGTYHYPMIIGHEFSGKVVEVNVGDEMWKNKRAAVFPLIPCGTCGSCRMGKYAQCKAYSYYGSRCDGGFTEYIVVNKWNLLPIPEKISYEEAAMFEPAAVAVHALKQAGRLLGKTIVIFGIGTIGMILAQMAEISGCSRIILVGRNEQKADFARKMGFESVIVKNGENAADKMDAADIVIEGCGDNFTLGNALRIAAPFATVVCLGNPVADVKLDREDYWAVLRKELTVKGTWNSSFGIYDNDWENVLSFVEKQQLDLKSLITGKYTLEQCRQAFENIKEGKEGMHLKSMFIMGDAL